MITKLRRAEKGNPELLFFLKEIVARVGTTVLSQLSLDALQLWLANPTSPMPGSVLASLPDLLRAASAPGASTFVPGPTLATGSRFSKDRSGNTRFRMRKRDSRISVWTPPLNEPIPALDPDAVNFGNARQAAIRLAESVSNIMTTHPYDNQYGIFGFRNFSEILDPARYSTSPRRPTNRGKKH
jgi:hypothetical protein